MQNDTTQQPQPRQARKPSERSNALMRKFAGKGMRAYSLLKHVGRRSGREYTTVVAAYPLGDGFVFALLYGNAANVDWCRNVMATGKCVLVTLRNEYHLENPEIIPAAKALEAYSWIWKRILASRKIDQFLWVHQSSDGL